MTTLLKRINNGIHVREISKKDFESAGFNHEAVRVDVREEAFVEVSDDVAEFLLKEDDGAWKEATAKEAERFAVRQNAKASPTTDADEAADAEKADSRTVGTAPAGGAVTTGGSNTASGAGSSA